MLMDICGALRERLRMADDLRDVGELRAGNRHEIVNNGKIVDTADIERTGEHHVHDLTDFARRAVFDGKNGAIAISLDNGVVCASEISIRHSNAVIEDLSCGNRSERPFNTGECDAHTLGKLRLKITGNTHGIAKKIHVVGTNFLVLNQCGVSLNQCFLSRGIVDRESVFDLIFGNESDGVHSFFKESGNFFVNCADGLSCVYQFFHKGLSFQFAL